MRKLVIMILLILSIAPIVFADETENVLAENTYNAIQVKNYSFLLPSEYKKEDLSEYEVLYINESFGSISIKKIENMIMYKSKISHILHDTRQAKEYYSELCELIGESSTDINFEKYLIGDNYFSVSYRNVIDLKDSKYSKYEFNDSFKAKRFFSKDAYIIFSPGELYCIEVICYDKSQLDSKEIIDFLNSIRIYDETIYTESDLYTESELNNYELKVKITVITIMIIIFVLIPITIFIIITICIINLIRSKIKKKQRIKQELYLSNYNKALKVYNENATIELLSCYKELLDNNCINEQDYSIIKNDLLNKNEIVQDQAEYQKINLLKKYKKLHDQKAINEEEFIKLKEEVLNNKMSC